MKISSYLQSQSVLPPSATTAPVDPNEAEAAEAIIALAGTADGMPVLSDADREAINPLLVNLLGVGWNIICPVLRHDPASDGWIEMVAAISTKKQEVWVGCVAPVTATELLSHDDAEHFSERHIHWELVEASTIKSDAILAMNLNGHRRCLPSWSP
jgi:hypothetical protein